MLFSNHFWFWVDFFELMANVMANLWMPVSHLENLGCEFRFE
jgi:hypothetical protein